MNETEGASVDGMAQPDRTVQPAGSPARPRRPMTMAEYEEATSTRGEAARARGLAAPYIVGGRDPDPTEGRRQERFYLRLLIVMVAFIVFGGFVISIVGLIVLGGGAE